MYNNKKTTVIVEGAIMIALATILSYVRVFELPLGGSVTLLSMLPIIVFSIKNGVREGLLASFAFSLIQFGQGIGDGLFGWPLSPAAIAGCIFADYIIAYTVLGLGGIFKDKGATGWLMGTVLVIFLRFVCHVLSGVLIFHAAGELWSGFSTDNSWLYSIIYNGSFMLPEMIFTSLGALALFRVPQTRRLMTSA